MNGETTVSGGGQYRTNSLRHLHLAAWMLSSMTLSNYRKRCNTPNHLDLSQWHNRLHRHLIFMTILMRSTRIVALKSHEWERGTTGSR